MLSLRQLQKAFAAELLADGSLHQGALYNADKVPVETGMNVYRNNSRASLRTALATMYPVVEKLVGPEFFRYMADEYALAYPLQSGNIQGFGQYLSDFLGNFDPVSTLPYLVDIALLETACQAVSPAVPPEVPESASTSRRTTVLIPELRFRLAPSCRLVSSSYPIFSIWQVNQDGYVGDDSVDLAQGPQSMLVLRTARQVELWRLPVPDTLFIDTLMAGATLSTVVETMTSHGQEFNLETLLHKYVQSGCLIIDDGDYVHAGGK